MKKKNIILSGNWLILAKKVIHFHRGNYYFFVGILGYSCRLLCVIVLPRKFSVAPCQASWNRSRNNLAQNKFVPQLMMLRKTSYLLHTLTAPSSYVSKFQVSMVIVWKSICTEELVLLLENGISPEWCDKEIHKITYKIVSELIEFLSEVKDTQENCVKRALFALDDRILLKKETKIFNIKKKLIDSWKIKLITLCNLWNVL